MRKFLCLVFVLFSSVAYAAHDAIESSIPSAEVVGKGRLSLVFWDVYDATLYAPQGKWDAKKPMALSIHYFREIEGKDIVDRSIGEMRKQGFSDEAKLAKWQKEMAAFFPQVKNGDELMGVYIPGKPTQFYLGEKRIGTIKDGDFGEHFFAIWLSEKTSEPKLRKQLLGEKA